MYGNRQKNDSADKPFRRCYRKSNSPDSEMLKATTIVQIGLEERAIDTDLFLTNHVSAITMSQCPAHCTAASLQSALLNYSTRTCRSVSSMKLLPIQHLTLPRTFRLRRPPLSSSRHLALTSLLLSCLATHRHTCALFRAAARPTRQPGCHTGGAKPRRSRSTTQ